MPPVILPCDGKGLRANGDQMCRKTHQRYVAINERSCGNDRHVVRKDNLGQPAIRKSALLHSAATRWWEMDAKQSVGVGKRTSAYGRLTAEANDLQGGPLKGVFFDYDFIRKHGEGKVIEGYWTVWRAGYEYLLQPAATPESSGTDHFQTIRKPYLLHTLISRKRIWRNGSNGYMVDLGGNCKHGVSTIGGTQNGIAVIQQIYKEHSRSPSKIIL